MIECRVIGTIQTPYTRMEDCPVAAEQARVPSLHDPAESARPRLQAGGRALVLYWLDLARRDMVQLSIRAGVRDKPIGVFSMRTPVEALAFAVVDMTR
ncbi:MAG: hypothetical protein WB624_11425 [Xanthobacteraceae bacterium]